MARMHEGLRVACQHCDAGGRWRPADTDYGTVGAPCDVRSEPQHPALPGEPRWRWPVTWDTGEVDDVDENGTCLEHGFRAVPSRAAEAAQARTQALLLAARFAVHGPVHLGDYQLESADRTVRGRCAGTDYVVAARPAAPRTPQAQGSP